MSSYQRSTNKKAWKWTPAKIAAFTMFGVMMVALAYFESVSSKAPLKTVPKQDEPSSISAPNNFDKEYQEFLKKGRKAVPQETLDSLNEIHKATSPQAAEEEPSLPDEPENASTEEKNSKSPINDSSSPREIPANLENKLSVGLIPPANTESPDQEIIGTLEEANPNEFQQPEFIRDITRNTQPDQTITEEFYTEEAITGKVAALSNGAPIQGVKVSVKGTDHRALTDENGRYSITVPGDPSHRTIQYSYQDRSTERDMAPGSKVMNILF